MKILTPKIYLYLGILLTILFNTTLIPAEPVEKIKLQNKLWIIAINPNTFELIAQPIGKQQFLLSAAQSELGTIRIILQKEKQVQWEYSEKGISISLELVQNELSIRIKYTNIGAFTWPVIQAQDNLQALIWPRWEGCYISVKDTTWIDYLIESNDWDTLEGLSMPFWGLDCKDYSLTYIITNPYNNKIRFGKADDRFQFRFTHEVTPNQTKKEYGFLIRLSDNTSPVEPAKQFRQWLIAQGKFVSMQDKLKSNPKVERLLGAPHVYLWGDNLITRHDIKRNRWQDLCKIIVEQSNSEQPTPGKLIKALMTPQHWSEVVEIATMQWPYDYIKNEVTTDLSRVLQLPDFYDVISWQEVKLSEEINGLLKRDRKNLSLPELYRLNGLLLYAAYPEYMLNIDNWGDGVSMKMLQQFQLAGFDRMLFCVEGWNGIDKRPEVAVLADKLGYLFGTYDSFHSIHNPAIRGTDATWETAQFDRDLFEKGPIVKRDGTKKTGFKGTGYLLSPIAARPYVEKRVTENMRKVPYSYYFVDCDAFGQVYDDYSPLHPATQSDDAEARIDRLAWISTTFQVVIGSEGGSSYAAPVIHIAEGMFSPGFGWGDADLKDKNSKYYLGNYYPPDGPKVFLQQVPIKEKYRYLYYAPQFRLPLYEIVFHDSVIATNHWGNSSLKFNNILDTVALTELLYQVPPLYHMNLDEFKKYQETMKKHYAFFSPLHRKLGFLPMTEFSWLTPDRLVQRTIFGNKTELIANYSDEPFEYQSTIIPSRSIIVKSLENNETEVYTP